jgi:hypothetical protein
LVQLELKLSETDKNPGNVVWLVAVTAGRERDLIIVDIGAASAAWAICSCCAPG